LQSPAPPSASPALSLNLFGTFHLRVEGAPVTARHSRKESWLLALLVLRHAQAVEREWLADTLWPDSLRSRALLRDTLSDLKRTLGSQASRLLSPTPRTLGLDLEGAEVDLLAFDAALRRGDAAALEQAIGLYQGTLLEGCMEEWVYAERQIREQQYLEALERLAALAQEAGESARAIVYWKRVVASDALREGAQRGLMEALAARGDYGAAVQVYHDFRKYLHAQLRAEPDAETTALLNRICARARRLPMQTPDRLPADVPLPLHVPRPWNELVGRRQELQEVGARLATARLVTLVGTGGVGKTRMALHLAEACAQDYPDGAWFVDLALLTDPAQVAHQAAAALGIPTVAGETPTETLRRFLRSRKALLLLDNCEHLLEACARLVDAILTGCPDPSVLATSRQPLGIPGEVIWHVPPLSLPPVRLSRADKVDPLATLMGHDALQLFAIRAGQAQPMFKVTAQNIRTIAAICRRLDGLPLAIELAAARTRSLSVESIEERLETNFRLLSGSSRAGQPRQQTLQATISWSYDLLTEPEQAMLQQLSVFAGGWTLEAAESVCWSDEGVGGRGSETPLPGATSGIKIAQEAQ
jgi:DNA-binding SARP family transcriptional activator